MEDWQYEPLTQVPADMLAGNSRLMNALRNLVYRVMGWWLRSHFHFEVEGAEIPASLPHFVLIANHSSHADTVALLAALSPAQRNRCYSAAAEDYFYTNPFKKWGARIMANTFPFRRRGGASQGLEACARILERGDSVIFYPEGTRSVDGALQPFRKGIGMLVQGTDFPVIPAYIDGAHRVLAKGRVVPRAAKIHVRLGAPERFPSFGKDEASAVAIAEHLQARVRALAPQDRR